MNQIAGLYWVYRNLPGYYWQPEVIDAVEERVSKLLRQEISMQKSLDKDHMANNKEGLQSMSIHDLEVIEHYYSID